MLAESFMVERSAPDSTGFSSSGSAPVSPQRPRLLLEVTRGKTRQPIRPVLTPRFLIGSSAACELQLGGSDIPALHSLIVCEKQTFRWERIADSPVLRCNGEATDAIVLQDGDRVTCGCFEFAVRMVPAAENFVPLPEREPQAARKSEAAAGSFPGKRQGVFASQFAGALSAAELADCLEAECREAARFEEGRRLGARALLQSALRRAAEWAAATEKPLLVDEQQVLAQLQQLLRQLQACVSAVEQGPPAEAFRHQQDLMETWNRVQDAEHHLTRRLSHLLEDLKTAEPSADDPVSRSAA